MTNGEKIKNIYPDLEIISEIKDVYVIILEGHNVWSPKLEVFKSWWNAECKEPSNSGKPNKSEIPTGSEDCISREQALDLLCKKCPVYNCTRKCISYKALDKVKQTREEIQKLVDMCGSDTVADLNMKSGLGLALEKIDKLIESEDEA